MKELIKIQSELKAPKGQYNNFGKYKYRSAEDILEAVKPLLNAQGCYITISDEIVELGGASEANRYEKIDTNKGITEKTETQSNGRIYIKATVTIVNSEAEKVSVSAYAREEFTKKGMDGAQITGSASSYARKYALNGLFAIDDTGDSDSMQQTTKKSVISDARLDKGIQSVISGSLPIERFKESLKIIDLTESQQAKVDEL